MLIALGWMVGVLLGLTGAGGGMLAVPALVFSLHWTVAQAAPVALMTVAASASVGALDGLRKGLARYRAAIVMALAALPMSALGLMLSHHISPRWLTALFILVMVLAAGRLLYAGAQASEGADMLICPVSPDTGRFLWTPKRAVAMSGFGALSGLLTGLLGVGGGFIMVPVLRFFTDLSMAAIVATSLMTVALVSSFSVFMAMGHLAAQAWLPAWPFMIAVLLGLLCGRWLAPQLPAQRVQQVFAILMLAVAAALGIREFCVLG
ncbi:MAG: sulfite exporter TauE/SafE family protein [Pseudomonadota bacterium]